MADSNVTSGMCKLAKSMFMCDWTIVDAILYSERVGGIVLAFLGLAGNIMTLVAVGKSARRTSSAWYICVIVVSDSAFLCIRPFLNYTMNTISCKVLQGMMFIIDTCCIWLTIVMTLERAFVVLFPLKATSVCTVKKSTAATTTVFVVSVIVGAPVFYLFDILTFCDLAICMSDKLTGTVFYKTWSMAYTIIAIYIPMPLLFAANTLIIITVLRAAKIKADMTVSGKDDATSGRNTEREITKVLLTISVVFTILNLPFYVLMPVKDAYPLFKYPCSHLVKILGFLNTLVNLMKTSSHALNGYVYCLRASEQRKLLTNILRFKKPPSSSNKN